MSLGVIFSDILCALRGEMVFRKVVTMGTISHIKDSKREAKMSEALNVKNTGLRGVAIADTKISNTDGENGILIYRGYRIEDLAKNSTFEETAYLLLYDDLPTDGQLQDFKQRLAK